MWNYVNGWFAYTVENMVIIEELQRERKQKIIPLNDQISTMILSKDFKHLVIGSATYNANNIANIYVLDCGSNKIVKTLQFHTRGVQNLVFADNGKFLVSIGNFKECTVVVWEWPSGKMLASSYTLDKINDVKISDKCYSLERQIEFVTVGRDQIQFWAFTKDKKLEYYDVFIEKTDDQHIPEATAVDYLSHNNTQYAVVGLNTGELLFVKYGEFKVTQKLKLSTQEITGVCSNHIINRVLVTSLDGHIYHWQLDKFAPDFMPSFVRTRFSSGVISIACEPLLNEGLAALHKGGIHYFNIQDQYQSIIVGSVDQNVPYATEIISDELLLTYHQSGDLKVWNLRTAEQVLGYTFRGRITALSYNAVDQKLTCYFLNNNEIRIINLGKFGPIETFVENDYVDTDRKSADYVVKAFDAILAGKASKFIVMKTGAMFALEPVHKENKSLLRATKVLEVPDLTDLHVYQEKSLIFVANAKGNVQTMLVDMIAQGDSPYGFTVMDDFDIFDNASNSNQQQPDEEDKLEIPAQVLANVVTPRIPTHSSRPHKRFPRRRTQAPVAAARTRFCSQHRLKSLSHSRTPRRRLLFRGSTWAFTTPSTAT